MTFSAGRLREQFLMRKRQNHCIALSTCILLALFSPDPGRGTEEIYSGLVKLTAVVNGQSRSGTGFVIAIKDDTAFIFTAAHVTKGSTKLRADFTVDPTKPYEAQVLQNDPQEDLCLVRVAGVPNSLSHLAISEEPPLAGQEAQVVGFPMRAYEPRFLGVTISSQNGTRLILDRQAESGSSGSPLIRENKVLGMVLAKKSNGSMHAVPGLILQQAARAWLDPVELPKAADDSGQQMTIRVQDIFDNPISNIRIARNEYLSQPTDQNGITKIQLDPRDKPGTAVLLSLAAEFSKEWKIIEEQINTPNQKETEPVKVRIFKNLSFHLLAHDAGQKIREVELFYKEEVTNELREEIISEIFENANIDKETARKIIESFKESSDPIARGSAEMLGKQYDKAVTSFESAKDKAREDIKVGEDKLVKSAKHLGHIYWKKGNYTKSVKNYQEILDYRPEDIGTYKCLSISLISNGAYQEAQDILKKAISIAAADLGPEEMETLVLRRIFSQTLWRLGQHGKARTDLKVVLAKQKNIFGIENPETLRSMWTLSKYMIDSRKYRDARVILEELVETHERIDGPQNLDTLMARSYLSIALFRLGNKLKAAQTKNEILDAVEVIKNSLESDNPKIILLLCHFVETLRVFDDYKNIERMERDIVDMRMEVNGPEHPDTLMAMRHLANTLKKVGKDDEASALEHKVATVRSSTLGKDHPSTLASRAAIAREYFDKGNYEEAIKMQREIFAGYQAKLGIGKRSTLTALLSLSKSLSAIGDEQEATAIINEFSREIEVTYGTESQENISFLKYLEYFYTKSEKNAEANRIRQDIEVIERRSTETTGEEELRAMESEAHRLERTGSFSAAQKIKKQVLDTYIKELGIDHPSTLRSMASLAWTLSQSELESEDEEIGKLIQTALKAKSEIIFHGAQYPKALTNAKTLADTFQRLGQAQEAVIFLDNVISIQEKSNGPRHPDTLKSMTDLASLLTELKDQRSLDLLESVFDLKRSYLGPEDNETLQAMDKLALDLIKFGHLQKACMLLDDAMRIRIENFGAEHHSTLLAMDRLIDVLVRLGDFKRAWDISERVVDLSRSKLGDEHELTAKRMKTMGEIHARLDSQQESIN